MNSEEFQTIN